MRDPVTRFPSEASLDWVARAVGDGARVVRGRRRTGGITSSVHELTVEDKAGSKQSLVLRRWVGARRRDEAATLVAQEVKNLARVATLDIPAPQFVAADPTGASNDGVASLLMTRARGQMNLAPRDPDDWLRQMAAALPRLHAEPGDADAFEMWIDDDALKVPPWTEHPDMWARAIELYRQGPTAFEPRFIHHDYQHFNMLWSRERLTGVIDWVEATRGPMDVDVGHCRLNLAVLYSADRADRFLAAYEAEAGRRVDPWWDMASLLVYLPGWGSSIQVQAGRRATVDRAGMHARIEEVLARALTRL